METTATLTSNTLKITGNLKQLDKDIVQLQQDYEIMKKNSDKPKQIYNLSLILFIQQFNSKITKTKQMFIKWAVELNAKIQAFLKTNTYISSYNLSEIKHNDQHISFKNLAMAKLTTLDSDIVKLNQAIEQEKLDSIRTEKENIENIQKSIDQLFSRKQISAANETILGSKHFTPNQLHFKQWNSQDQKKKNFNKLSFNLTINLELYSISNRLFWFFLILKINYQLKKILNYYFEGIQVKISVL